VQLGANHTDQTSALFLRSMGALSLSCSQSLRQGFLMRRGAVVQAGLLATKEAQPVHLCTTTTGHIAVALGGAASFSPTTQTLGDSRTLCGVRGVSGVIGIGWARANEPTRRAPPSPNALDCAPSGKASSPAVLRRDGRGCFGGESWA